MKKLIGQIDTYSLMLLGSVVLASLLPVRGIGAEMLSWVVVAAITMLFFLHGAKLSREAIIQGLSHWRLHLTVLAATFLIFPVVGLGAQWALSPLLSASLASGLLFLTLLPSTVQSSIAFTSIAGGNVPAAICSASLSNLLGIFLTPLLVSLLMTHSSSGVQLEAIEAIVFQLLVPFVGGHLARPLVIGLLDRHKHVVGQLDRGSILLIVYSAFSAAVVEGLWHSVPAWQIGMLLAASAVILLIMLGVTRGASRLFGFDAADEKAILFCGSKKSLASGVPIAGALFAPSQVGAIILPLMIFHQLQLFACAAIAQHYARKGEGTGEVSADIREAAVESV